MSYTPGFERWWQAYPRYKRKGKGAAFKSWQKHNLEGRTAELVEVIEAQAERDDHFKKYTPMPSTYLNQARYDDDVPKPKRSTPHIPQAEAEGHYEKDPYVKSVNRVAIPWLMRRGGLPEEKLPGFKGLVRSLAKTHRPSGLTVMYQGRVPGPVLIR